MKKTFMMVIAAMFPCMAAIAQTLSEGFYRVQNNGSKRYLYVQDCVGEVSTIIDMGAIELWPSLDRAISDPGSIIYLKKVGSQYDLTSQATGVFEITRRYMTIAEVAPGLCQVYNSGQYLYETGNKGDKGFIGAKTDKEMPGKSAYRLWLTTKLDVNTDNYFGFKPSVTASGKYYAPFYADFAYTPKSAVKTWYVNKVDKKNGVAVVKEIQGTVARSQAVFVECPAATPSGNKVDLTVSEGNAAAANLMKGVFFSNGDRSGLEDEHKNTNPACVPFDAKTMRVLGTNSEGKLAFVSTSANLLSLEVYQNDEWVEDVLCIPHNQSYLTVDADCPATLIVMTEAEYDATFNKSVEGDVNGDNMVNIGDVTRTLEYIKEGASPTNADVNKDGRVNIGDVTRILEIIKNK